MKRHLKVAYLYLLGFKDATGKLAKHFHAAYYLGSCLDPVVRIEQHRSGKGSPLVRAAIAAGLTPVLVALQCFPNESECRRAEAKMKRWHNNSRVLKAMRGDAMAIVMPSFC